MCKLLALIGTVVYPAWDLPCPALPCQAQSSWSVTLQWHDPIFLLNLVLMCPVCGLLTGQTCLALPKLNLQFLTFHDYLLRNFNLFRLEATYEIREDISDVIGRVGAYRYGLPSHLHAANHVFVAF